MLEPSQRCLILSFVFKTRAFPYPLAEILVRKPIALKKVKAYIKLLQLRCVDKKQTNYSHSFQKPIKITSFFLANSAHTSC